MYIKEIIKLDDVDINNSVIDIIVSDGYYNCIVQYDNPKLNEGDNIENTLIALTNDNIMISNDEIGFYKLNDYYQYRIVGIFYKLDNINIVFVGKILIEINNDIPKDIKSNQKVEFICDRLDL